MTVPLIWQWTLALLLTLGSVCYVLEVLFDE
jgi:hypothetical protein